MKWYCRICKKDHDDTYICMTKIFLEFPQVTGIKKL